MTKRRDYKRSLKLPGYVAFTVYVASVLKKRKALFILLALFYGVLSVVLGGISSQQSYSEISSLLREGSSELLNGGMSKIGQASILSVTAFTGANRVTSDVQQIYMSIVLLLTWLTTVWLLRAILAKINPSLRDGLYNAGAPIVSTAIVLIILLIQLLPVALASLAYAGLSSIGLLEQGFSLMIFWAITALLASISLYWITSTFIALIAVTVPGTYPMTAIKAAGDIVIGRRIRVLYRLLWLVLTVAIVWFVLMIPLVLINSWLTDIWSWISIIPIVPVAASILSAVTVVWAAAYIYLLYRKIIDDESPPA